MTHPIQNIHHYPEVGIPLFWPLGFALEMEKTALDLTEHNLKFLSEVTKTQLECKPPVWATKNHIDLELHTLRLRNFSHRAHHLPILVLPPYAGHSSTIADFHQGQSLIATLLKHGCPSVFAIDWKSATPTMQNYDIDNYLAEINVCIDQLGGKVCLVGLCQGGWCATMIAARFPHKVSKLVIVGSPIDTNAGEGVITDTVHTLPMQFYEELVSSGGGLMKGAFMLEGFKNMHPVKQYVEKFIELYEHIDDPSYTTRFEQFERWYEYTIDLPGTWYLQAIQQLFKENRLAKNQFVGLGKQLQLKDIACPAYLLAGESDDITPVEQVFSAANLLGTPADQIQKEIASGGHIGLFMGHQTLATHWVKIAQWLSQTTG